MEPRQGATPVNEANRLGMDYRAEAIRLPWRGPIWDVHVHLTDLESAREFFGVAELYGVSKIWSMSPLEVIDELRNEFGDRIEFIAVPNYAKRDQPETFTTDWLRRIEGFARKGCRICKIWAAPRGIDLHPDALRLDSPIRREGIALAKSLGMMFMVHVGDPDTWFATHYRDSTRYGTKEQHLATLERTLDEHADVTWLGAHMAGTPERLDVLQGLLDRHPNFYVDCSATKWMVRELSKQPEALAAFCRRNSGRILFGSDIVAGPDKRGFDLHASRYWALRTLLETDYRGSSPIVDPDLPLVDPTLPKDAAPELRGAALDEQTLQALYHDAANQLLVSRKSS